MSEKNQPTTSEMAAAARRRKLATGHGTSDPVDPSGYEFSEVEPGVWRNIAGDEYDYRNVHPCDCEGPNETYPYGYTCGYCQAKQGR